MAAVVTIEQTIELGGTEKLYFGTIALDNSYPTGGEAIDASGNERFDFLIASPGPAAASGFGYQFCFDAPNQKLLAAYNDYDAGADGPHIQVPNTTDLSAITAIPFMAKGA